jgi:S1-C subfamily serine protease
VDFAGVVSRLNAAVVNVDAATRGDSRAGAQWRRDLADGPTAPHEGTGSGFFIDPRGFILTNYHVIDGADRVTVTMSDGRAFTATVTGIDPALDVALLKISGSDRFPTATLGDSNRLQVGPVGLRHWESPRLRALGHRGRRQLPRPKAVRSDPGRLHSDGRRD